MNNIKAEQLLTARKALQDVIAVLQVLDPWRYQAETALWHEVGRAIGTAKFGLGMSGASIPVSSRPIGQDAYPELL